MLPFDSSFTENPLRPTIVWHPDDEMNIDRHVFPTEKFRLTKELLIQQNLFTKNQIILSPKATDQELLSVLAPSYLNALRTYKHNDQTRKSELPITPPIVESMIRTAGGSILCGRKALETGAACHLGGGYHHGYPDHAEGFCYLNDVAIAIQVLLDEGLAERIAVVDLDVHQGNGRAATFAGDPRVFALSIHEDDLSLRQKEISNRDIALDRDITPEAYLEQVKVGLDALLNFGPELVVYATGVDVFQGDKLGHLNLGWTALRQRDELVLETVASLGIPFFTVVAGGYARELKETLGLHAQTVAVAFQVCRKYQSELSKGREKFSAA